VRPASLWLMVTFVGCATTSPPPAPPPKPWRPDPGPVLRQACQQDPVTCRLTAEKLASAWSTDDEAFGALKAFTAACEAGDAPSCSVVDTRFKRPMLGSPAVFGSPVPRPSGSPSGTWRATCDMSRGGKVTSCMPDPSNPPLRPGLQDLVKAHLEAPYSAATLDGRPFGCPYVFEVEWWQQ